MGDRCLEEFKRLRAETVRLVRRAIERRERINDNLDLWIFGLRLTEQSPEERENEDGEAEMGQGTGVQSSKCNLPPCNTKL